MGCCSGKPHRSSELADDAQEMVRNQSASQASVAAKRGVVDPTVHLEPVIPALTRLVPEVSGLEPETEYLFQWQHTRLLTDPFEPLDSETAHLVAITPSLDYLNHHIRLRVRCPRFDRSVFSNTTLVGFPSALRVPVVAHAAALEATFPAIAAADLRARASAPYVAAVLSPAEFKVKKLKGGPGSHPGSTLLKWRWSEDYASAAVVANPVDETAVTVHFAGNATTFQLLAAEERIVFVLTFRLFQAMASPLGAALLGAEFAASWRKEERKLDARGYLTGARGPTTATTEAVLAALRSSPEAVRQAGDVFLGLRRSYLVERRDG
eukprot:TRINITY_DN8798_c0_g1_i1.p1 TRINITY_DN8798_c0_g1~~TRINITY_DN8798_c0_g1_i1.p1  ORF type:complete len:323 (-),score=44.21 TRINITY_DN8798_c0_g1_i1:432-1400(-)